MREVEQMELDPPLDPWDDSESDPVSAPEVEARDTRGMLDLVYRFSMERYEPDPLLIRASRLSPQVCFVLGWVAPNAGEQSSRFIHNGDTRLYRLPARREESVRVESYRRHGILIDDIEGADN